MGAGGFLGSGVKECEKIDGPWVMECEKMVGSRVKECDKIIGPWVMGCEKIDGPKAMEFEKIVGPRVKKHANSFRGERPIRNKNDPKLTSTSPVSSPKWYP